MNTPVSQVGMRAASSMPELIAEAQTSEERFLRQIFVRDQMAEWSKSPLLMNRAEGVHYWDVTGKRYLDALSGIYTVSVGHGNRRVIDAIRQQFDMLHFSPPMHGTNPVAVQLANLIAEVAPGDLNTVKFECAGSEVTEAAIKIARQYHKLTGNPGKYKIITRYQSWHGSTLGALSASGLKSRKTVNEPLAPGFLHVFPPTCYRCPFGKQYPSCDITCATLIGDVMEMEDPATVAAVMVEPIGHTGGIIDPPPEYLPKLRELCTKHNVLLIFDEIITGMGRTGELFAADTFGVVPDVLVTAKGLSGGFLPLSAMITRKPIADAFWGPIETNPGFVEGHTFEGHPIACAAGIAVLREILERDLCANARAQGQVLRAGFERLSQKYGIIGDIRGKGLLQGVEWVADVPSKRRFADPIGMKIGRRALHNGLLCRFDPHWLAFGPALISTTEQIEEMLDLLDRSIDEVFHNRG
ncbi:aminotransferase family protein [Tuwongella immobilis]|uniref:Aspartate aminotransferase family protein n=1 Tax=Tuwongella immobilis TaxID=692036 RepID=A0A6C2YIY5_9BACT|nr:aspartate aminotransferase family protein [Tuwongella immobilis]VIP00942.1 aminotransferase : Adenosylmethionine-8-amino-7-oxononanoate aminotransferase OS=Singulisphaera acidiphila (strain ATCC BAA-1392 / DSM 18658 / VKM B-2454 / MOB10) GN=Sinac_5603 PE=3 SV=1: Aminotran_3 [Tuwongella immobilis]VTR97302.1 aminotransferase : Adenosylmethionine-8-amino-7-oxononanoate aminotransferase OS=Singulisphaera acidiphila (strain ATCC BAA-1392 / DSM 18658 / VKM B-2454 / MOB10) GN=Sinac_5603 PE=3 SV=1: Am